MTVHFIKFSNEQYKLSFDTNETKKKKKPDKKSL